MVDLACMRDAMKNLGSEPKRINPLVCDILSLSFYLVSWDLFSLIELFLLFTVLFHSCLLY